MADNLKLQQDINKAIADRNKMLADGEAIIQRQAKLYATLLEVMAGKKGSEAIDEMIKKLDSAKVAMESMAQGAQQATEKTSQAFNVTEKDIDRLFGQTKGLSGYMQTKFPKAFTVAAGAVLGLKQGFQNVLAVGRSFLSVSEGVVEGIFNIGKAILSIPLKIFDGLIEKAQAGGGGNELAQAFENVRKEFGSFKEDVSKNVITSFRSLKGELATTGLSVWKVLGTMAQRLEYVTELAKGMGPTFHILGKEIAGNAEQIVAYQKGLGISQEEMQGVSQRAIAMGTTLTDQLQEIANQSLQMGDAFGLSSKMISRDVGRMIKDVKNFGSLTVQQMTEASVYTRKLGIEFTKLLGLIDKFDTFEGAAESAAKLSQAFGVNVNAFEMMKEQDPSKRLDELRKSFTLAGKSAENLSRQELKLLADATGLDEETAKLALSSKNAGLSMDEIRKKSDAAQKKQLSQTEVMNKLADSIERLVQSGGPQGFKGFFDAFLKGIGAGIANSPQFIKLMMDIRHALMQTFQEGRKLGQFIVDTFPGLKDIFSNLSAVVQKIPAFFVKLREELAKISKGGGIEQFFDNMEAYAKEWVGGAGSPANLLIEGFKKTFKRLGELAGEGISYVIKKLTEGFKRATEFLKNPKEFLASVRAGADSGKSFLLEVLDPIIKAVSDKKMWDDLWKAFVEFAPEFWKTLKDKAIVPMLKAVPTGWWLSIAAVFFGPAVGNAFLGAGANVLGGVLKDTFFGAAKEAPKIASAAAKTAAGSEGMLSSFVGPLLGNPYVAAAAAIAALGVVGVGMSKGVQKFQEDVTKEIGGDKESGKIGSAVAGVVQMLSFGAIGDEAAKGMAVNFAKFKQEFDKQIENIFGPGLAKDIKNIVGTQFDMLIDLGDFFRSIFGGDIGGAVKALGNLLSDIVKQSFNQIKFVFLDLPTKIIDWLSVGADALANWLDSLFQENSEVSFTDVLLKGFSNLTNLIGPILESFGKLIAGLVLKLPGILVRLSTSITSFVARIPAMILGVLEENFAKFGFGRVVNYYVITPLKDSFMEIANVIGFGGKFIKNALDNLALIIKTNGKEGDLKKALGSPVEDYKKYKDELKKVQAPESSAKFDYNPMAKDINGAIAPAAEQAQKADLNQIVKMSSQIEKLSSIKPDEIKKSADKIVEAFNKGGIENSFKAIVDMIKSVETLNEQITVMTNKPLEIKTKLKELATKLGMGAQQTYQIKNNGIDIKINLNVTMDAGKVEEVIVRRSDSKIRKAFGDTGLKDTTSLNSHLGTPY